MIEKRLVQWYASDAGIDLDIAEREIVLTYVLRIISDQSLLPHLAVCRRDTNLYNINSQ
jgi:hypothetical protein